MKAIKHLTPQIIEKSIKAGKLKKMSYLIEGEGKIEFTPPKETHWNRMLANHQPLEQVDESGKLHFPGTLGNVKRFFIQKSEQQKLLSIFLRFEIPEDLYQDLTWCYLNMIFAGADSMARDQFDSKYEHSLNSLYQAFDFLELLASDSIKISSIQIIYSETSVTNAYKTSKPRTLKMKDFLDTGYIEDVLKLFRQVEAYPAIQAFREINQQKIQNPVNRYMGHKNSHKHDQAHYAGVLFDFLIKNVFRGLGTLVNDMPKLRSETARLKKIYSDRRLCHFIGILMWESGLLPFSSEKEDDDLIDLIKKKLSGQLSRRASKRKMLLGKN